MNFELLPKDKIRKWVKSLTHPQQKAIGEYCDIPYATLRRIGFDERTRFSRARQERLSKAIALWENGLIVKKRELVGRKAVHTLIVPEKPRPLQRYFVRFDTGRPVLVHAPRPAVPKDFPNPLLTTRK